MMLKEAQQTPAPAGGNMANNTSAWDLHTKAKSDALANVTGMSDEAKILIGGSLGLGLAGGGLAAYMASKKRDPKKLESREERRRRILREALYGTVAGAGIGAIPGGLMHMMPPGQQTRDPGSDWAQMASSVVSEGLEGAREALATSWMPIFGGGLPWWLSGWGPNDTGKYQGGERFLAGLAPFGALKTQLWDTGYGTWGSMKGVPGVSQMHQTNLIKSIKSYAKNMGAGNPISDALAEYDSAVADQSKPKIELARTKLQSVLETFSASNLRRGDRGVWERFYARPGGGGHWAPTPIGGGNLNLFSQMLEELKAQTGPAEMVDPISGEKIQSRAYERVYNPNPKPGEQVYDYVNRPTRPGPHTDKHGNPAPLEEPIPIRDADYRLSKTDMLDVEAARMTDVQQRARVYNQLRASGMTRKQVKKMIMESGLKMPTFWERSMDRFGLIGSKRGYARSLGRSGMIRGMKGLMGFGLPLTAAEISHRMWAGPSGLTSSAAHQKFVEYAKSLVADANKKPRIAARIRNSMGKGEVHRISKMVHKNSDGIPAGTIGYTERQLKNLMIRISNNPAKYHLYNVFP